MDKRGEIVQVMARDVLPLLHRPLIPFPLANAAGFGGSILNFNEKI